MRPMLDTVPSGGCDVYSACMDTVSPSTMLVRGAKPNQNASWCACCVPILTVSQPHLSMWSREGPFASSSCFAPLPLPEPLPSPHTVLAFSPHKSQAVLTAELESDSIGLR